VDKARAELTELQAGLREGLEKLRELIYNLYPRELSRAGLVGAIGQFVDRIAKSAGMDVVFEIRGLEEEFPAVLEATLYCIVQEALNNIKKHAQASKVSLALRCEDGQLTMAIADDGCGFDLEALLAEPSHHNTFGLLSMEERARLAGGTMELHSHPGAGTTLRFRIPVRSCG
jgi:signal transduction histidine kinase